MTFDEWAREYFSEGLMPPAGFRDAWDAAVKSEREACAKACESLFDADDDSCNEAEKCAEAIRSRSNAGIEAP